MNTLVRMLARLGAATLVAACAITIVPARAADLPVFRAPEPVVRTLPNGLRVAVFPDRRLPLVQMQLMLPAGVAQEPAETPGVANLTAQLLRAGTTSRTAGAFAADLDYLGGAISATAAREYSTVSGTFLAADFEAGLELLADAAVNPVFPPEEVDRFRAQDAGMLLQTRQSPAAVADERLWAMAFEGHPYGRNPLGTLQSLQRMNRDAVQAFHRDYYRPDRAVLAIAGDVDPEQAFALANDRFGRWAGHAATPPSLPAPVPPAAPRIRIVDRPGQDQSEVRIGLICPPRSDPDAVPLQLADYVLGGGGLTSRLSRSLRVTDGLSYDVRSSTTLLRDAGLVSLATVARNDSVAILVARMRDELARMRTQPPDEREVAGAQRYLENSFPLQFQTPGALIAQWLGADFYGLGSVWLDRYVASVAAVSGPQVAAAAARWLDPSRMVVVVVGPAAELRGPLAALGSVEVVGLDATPAAKTATATAAAPASPEQAKRGHELLGQLLTAHGGLERLRRVIDSTQEGDMVMQMGGNELVVRVRQVRKEPLRMRFSTRLMQMENGQILNGPRGWLYSGVGDSMQVMDADSVGMQAMRSAFRSDIVHVLLAAAAPDAVVAWRGPGRADGRDADLVEVVPPVPGARERLLLYVDVRDHRLIAVDQGEARPGALRRVYRDYRRVGGVLWPFYEERLLGGTRTMTISTQSVTLDSGVSDRMFDRPVSRARNQPLR